MSRKQNGSVLETPVTSQTHRAALAQALKATASKVPKQVVRVPAIDVRTMTIRLTGDTPLLCNKFSTKAKTQISDKQQKKAKQARAAKNPEECFRDSLYPMPGKKGKYGFPASGFKKSAVDSCSFVEGIFKSVAKGAFHVVGNLIEIEGPKPEMQEDIVRIGPVGRKVADIRYRGVFKDWSVRLLIRYNANVISPEQIVNLFNVAGFSVGVGEWRPQRDGSNGTFHVV